MRRRIGRTFIVAACLVLLAAIIVANMAGWRGDVFVNLVRMGWTSFMFVRLVALLLVLLAIRRLWRTSVAAAASMTAVVILGLGTFSVLKSYSPEGIYGFVGELEPMNDAPDIAPEFYHKDHFWRFSRGKVEDCFGNVCGRYGRYEKTADGWIVIHEVEEPFAWKLQFSVFGFRLRKVEDHDPVFGELYPRRIIPFARPYWMPDWLQ
jgi:hypothetical protein